MESDRDLEILESEEQNNRDWNEEKGDCGD